MNCLYLQLELKISELRFKDLHKIHSSTRESTSLFSNTNHFFLFTRNKIINTGKCIREYRNNFLDVELDDSL